MRPTPPLLSVAALPLGLAGLAVPASAANLVTFIGPNSDWATPELQPPAR